LTESKYVVIGSNSFSGGWMVDTLISRCPKSKVIGISRSPEQSDLFLPYKNHDHKNFSFCQMDINKDTKRVFELLEEFKPDHVINYAAQGEVGTSWKYPEQWFETNAVGIVKITNYLKDKKWLKRYVHISTPEVYGSCEGNIDETSPLNPSTPYAASKAAGDLFIFTLIKQYGFPAILIRPTNVYGKHQQLYRIIPRTLICLKTGKKVQLHGGGKAVKSYIHIKDVCDGILSAVTNGKPGSVYHLSPDSSISIKELVELLCEKTGHDHETSVEAVDERPGQDAAYIIDSSKARKELSWKPMIGLSDGIDEMISWVNENYEKIMKEPLDYEYKP
jgi:dTDP-glucose 4,6-dehydratase